MCRALLFLQVDLVNRGTWIFTTVQYRVKENYTLLVPQGWLARDHEDWVRSHQMVRTVARWTDVKLVFWT